MLRRQLFIAVSIVTSAARSRVLGGKEGEEILRRAEN
jgi:hypothetical protein